MAKNRFGIGKMIMEDGFVNNFEKLELLLIGHEKY